ncbi:hypothetical protein C6P45_002754 [Maudiozyma exigua]|uniref:AN1-type domain-containing protein n=1 Tax=Maudiozyma exigua TaxID=34358 RepID=A0A9P6VWZ9_MAUEX|nr:hypothetical protein C6P45_002754 [Kazachstania exigua]
MTTQVRETGMLDVGTHCTFCKQIDFLPFHCKFCDGDFCSKHRLKEDHHCIALQNESTIVSQESKSDGGRFFRSLLPQRAAIRVQQAQAQQIEEPKVKSTLNQHSLNKLLKFFKSKRKSATIRKGKQSSAMAQLIQCKKVAKGDSKIPQQNRIYLYVTVIDDENDSNKYNEVPLFVNKMWPIGRVLDSLAHLLNVKNINVRINTSTQEKLFIYKQTPDAIQQLDTSGRTNDILHDLDNVYIIRGSEN